MSKAEILAELPALGFDERREILDRIFELDDHDLINCGQPTAEEKALLDQELEDYEKNPNAGSSWEEVETRLRHKSPL